MFINILKMVFRSLLKDRFYVFLNLVGLAVSFGCFLIIFLYIRNELTFDQHITDHDRIYRLVTESQIGGRQTGQARTGRMVGPLLAQNYPQFDDYVRLVPVGGVGTLVMNGETSRMWESDAMLRADNKVFELFSLDVLAGNSETALTEPRSIAISRSVAEFYFGDSNPIGQSLGIQIGSNAYTVVLVFTDLPGNTSHHFDMLVSNDGQIMEAGAENYFETGIALTNSYTFFKLPADLDPGDFDAIAADFYQRFIDAGARQFFSDENVQINYQLQSLESIHLSPALEGDVPKGNPVMLYALAAVAIFVLGNACINYMNLSTAMYAKRAREVGVRRTLGAEKKHLVGQFLTEGVLLSLLALLLGISITEILLATVLEGIIPGTDLSIFTSNSAILYLELGMIGVIIGLVSGCYPAFYFSSVNPVEVFRPVITVSGRNINVRNILIGLQMLVSVSVIAGALIMYQQVSYMKNRPLGFDKENKLVVRINFFPGTEGYRPLMTELSRHPGIHQVTMTDQVPGTPAYDNVLTMQDDQGEEINMIVDSYIVDESYLQVFNIPLMAGRNFAPGNRSTEDVSVFPWLVNETLVRRMGWKDPVGQQILLPGGVVGEVMGVVEDFNYVSLHEEVRPLLMDYFYDDWRWQRYLVMDIDPTEIAGIITYVEEVMNSVSPETPFMYEFLDESLDTLYFTEQQQMLLAMSGSLVCIIIAVLGMTGLTSLTIDQKSKEIGIRRILGASTVRILTVMFRGIFAITIAATIFASVLVLYSLTIWLQGFAYRISINPMVFISAAALVLGVSVLIIAMQSFHISRERPAKALRYE